MARPKYKVTETQVKDIIKLYKAQVPVSQIARFYNISVSSVHYYTGHGEIPRLSIPEILEVLAV